MNPIVKTISHLRKVPGLAITKESAQPFDLDYFRDNGYILVNSVFNREEFERIRGGFLKSYELGYQEQDLLSNPLMNHILLNKNVIEVAHAALGGRPTYYGDGSISRRPGSTPIHRDNVDRNDSDGPDWNEDFKIIKCAVYLQPYSEIPSGGMIVRRGSHVPFMSNGKRKILSQGGIDISHPCRYLMIEAGDMLVWDLRAVHAGGVRLAKGSLTPLHPKLVGKVPNWAKQGISKDRSAIFFTLGIHNHHLDRYMTQLKTVVRECSRMRNSTWDEEVVRVASESGLDVFDLPREIAEDLKRPRMPIGLHRSAHPLTYKPSYQRYE